MTYPPHTRRIALLIAALAACLAACAPPATATPTRPAATLTPAAPSPTRPPPTLPATWTPTATLTPRPPTATPTLTATPTPLDTAELCANFRVRYAPDPDAVMGRDAPAYFVWSDVPRGVHVRLVLARPREFVVVRADAIDYRSNGVLIPLQTVPFSGAIDWQLLLIYEGRVLCRLEGQMQKATPTLADLFAPLTPSPTGDASLSLSATPGAAAETPATDASEAGADATTPPATDAAPGTPTPGA